MIVFVVIFLLWLLVGLGCGLPGMHLSVNANEQGGLNADDNMESIVIVKLVNWTYAVYQKQT
jgi:hypothetical protein